MTQRCLTTATSQNTASPKIQVIIKPFTMTQTNVLIQPQPQIATISMTKCVDRKNGLAMRCAISLSNDCHWMQQIEAAQNGMNHQAMHRVDGLLLCGTSLRSVQHNIHWQIIAIKGPKSATPKAANITAKESMASHSMLQWIRHWACTHALDRTSDSMKCRGTKHTALNGKGCSGTDMTKNTKWGRIWTRMRMENDGFV